MLRLTTRVAARRRVVAARASTEYAFDDAKTTNWPRTKANTIINVVPAGEAHVVERARQPMGVKGPGYWVGVPGLDAIAAVVDTREQTIVVPSPPGILSRDGTGVDAAATANVCIVDAEKARQCLMDPAQKLAELAGLLLQKEVATIAADELALKRETIESSVKHQLATDAAPASWGLEVREFKLAALTGRDAPDKEVAAKALAEKRAVAAASVQRVELAREAARRDAAYAHEAASRETRILADRIVTLAEAEAKATKIRAAATADAILVMAAVCGDNAVAADVVARTLAAALSRPVAPVSTPAAPVVSEEEPSAPPAPPPPPAAQPAPEHPVNYFPPVDARPVAASG
jgi:regulator of protease activity HflC (stomatin/prohibitin superfamily)